jgi:hypothetical protein
VLNAVSCSATNACMAVGDWGLLGQSEPATHLFAEHWDGRRWKLLSIPGPPGVQSVSLDAISCPTAKLCMAVGSMATDPMFARWNGRQWTVRSARTPTGQSRAYLTAVSCPTRSFCAAVGYASRRNGRPRPLAEHWTGVGWTVQRTPTLRPSIERGGAGFSGVFCTTARTCVATGAGRRWFIERYS